MGYVDKDDASNVAFNTNPSGLGSGSVQSAIDALAVSVAGGVKNYNSISSTTFSTSAGSDTLITGMSITPLSGTYAVWFNASVTGSGSSQQMTYTVYKGASAVPDSIRNSTTSSGSHIMSLSTQTIAQFDGATACSIFVNPGGTSMTVNQRSLLLIRLGP